MKIIPDPGRREFIKIAITATGGLILGLYIPSGNRRLQAPAETNPHLFKPNAWLRLDPDGTTTVIVSRSEMGQGVRTALPMIVAEELEVNWSSVRIEPAIAAQYYGNMTTGGSTSIRESWEPLRQAGATARELLISAAAIIWAVDRSSCRAKQGQVLHLPTGRQLPYGELLATAAELPIPTEAPLKQSEDFTILGRSLARLDSPEKVSGTARFGFDLALPGLQVAMVEHCPVLGGKVAGLDPSAALAVAGVRQVFEIENGVAIVADSPWAALEGRRALRNSGKSAISWDEGEHAALDSESLREMLELKSREEGTTIRREGDIGKALTAATRRLEAIYELPFLAHAPMEPMNCTAVVRPGAAEIWAPTQSPQWAQATVAAALELPRDQVKVHTTLIGGGFGRRLLNDYAVEAAEISRHTGTPIKLLWTREDDIRHDWYRPASYHRVAAALDANNQLTGWKHRVTAPSISQSLNPRWFDPDNPDIVDGARQFPYRTPNLLVDCVIANSAVPVGWWRSVYNSQNAFVNECFMDELAVAAGSDPYQFRLQLLPTDSRLRGVLELVADHTHWGQAAVEGRFRGIACHACFGSYLATVTEISLGRNGEVRVHKVTSALDCGPIVHPDLITAQVEGAVAFALTATLWGEITLEKGRIRESNFSDYRLLTMAEMPEVEVHILPSSAEQGGIGEPGVPPVAPAVCNAIFAATGKRIRKLPVRQVKLD